jgi:hypothetical protein
MRTATATPARGLNVSVLFFLYLIVGGILAGVNLHIH